MKKERFLDHYLKNKQHRQFYLWDVETFNDILEKTKIPINCDTFKNSKGYILKAIEDLELYLNVLDKFGEIDALEKLKKDESATEEQIKEMDAEINYINSNIGYDIADFEAAYPSYDMMYYKQNEKGETIDAWYKHLNKEYQDWIEEYEGITKTNLVEDEKRRID